MFTFVVGRSIKRRHRSHHHDLRFLRPILVAWDRLEERALLAAPPISLISENLANNGADVGALFPSISANGQYVAFESGSFEGDSTPAPSDLVSGLTVENDAPNVYLRDLATNTTICLSVDYQSPHTTGNDDSRYPIISADGNTVVFLSNATDLVADDNTTTNSTDDVNVFAWSSATGKLTLVTTNYEGTGPAYDPDPQYFGTAENISVSANGDYIAYDSEATDLVHGENDDNYTPNVYVYDLLTNKNILVSASDTGDGIGNASSDDPVISSDGSTVAYDSLASDLDPNLSSPEQFENYQVYASTLNYTNDTVASTTLVSVDPTDTTAGDGTSIAPSLSDNGQMVAFQSASDNLVNVSNGGSYNDVYVRDLATNTTELVSIDATRDATGDSSSFAPQISGDGDHVLFYSLADDLTTTPVNTQTNVFERNLTTDTTQLVSVDYEGTAGANDTSTLANRTTVNSSQQATGQISQNGQYVTFDSVATNLVANFQQKSGGAPYGTDVYLRNTVAGTTTLLSHAVGTTTIGGTGESVDTDMISSGLNVVFQSAFPGGTDNLVSNDTNAQTQLFDAVLAPLPAVSTVAATSITSTGATLNGSVNPEGSATTYSFVYGTSSTLTSGTTTTSAVSAGSGTTAESETAALTGLTPDTKYYFEVQATNAGGTTVGSILNFTTSAAAVTKPAVTTESATSITSTGATLNASVNPEGNATTYSFVYGTSSTLSSGTTTTTAASAGSGTSAEPETAAISGLTANTKYYFEVQATNAGGTTVDSILNFTTSAAAVTKPAVTTESATSITSTGATLNASINPEGNATTYSFVYGTSSTLSSGTTTTTAASAGSGTSAEPETAAISGLTADTKYYFEVQATNAGGTTVGSILNFTTSAAAVTKPAVTTESATSITSTGATLNASINPEGNATTYSFVYGTSSTLSSGTTTTTAASAGSGTSAEPETAAISGLTADTEYYFEVQATNAGGTTVGSILNFTTSAAAVTKPAVTTESATSITSTGATLNASVNPEGNATTYSFVYGTSSTLSSGTTTTTAASAGSGTSAEPETAAISGLTPDTKYYFEVQATNAGGTTVGSILNFTTSAAAVTKPAVTTESATSITSTGATINGTVNPEGSATTYSFVYGTTPTLTAGTTTTAAESAGSGIGDQSEAVTLTGLATGTTYYDCIVATDAGGTSRGTITSFATPAILQFSSGQFTANVTDGSGQLVLTRTGDLSGTLTVSLTSPGGHEVAPISEMVTFGPNVLSTTVSVPIANDGQPGEGDAVIRLSLSSPGPGATLGTIASASLVIVDDNPPLVTITSLQHPTIKVGTGKKAKKEVVLELQFSGPVEDAGNLAAYMLVSGKTKKRKTTYTKVVPLSSAVYNYPGTPPNTVTLFPATKLSSSTPGRLTVIASQITDSYGRALAQNFVGTFT